MTRSYNIDDVGSSRIYVLMAGFCMQLALGAVYGWSVFVNPLRETFDASRFEVTLIFTVTLVMLGLTAGLAGHLLNQYSPRAIATLAGILYGGGIASSGFAPTLSTFYLTHGIIGGIGLGFGYIVPLAVLLGWFPDRRGQITGVAVTGFGLGALITSPLAAYLLDAVGVSNTLLLLGVTYLVVVVVSAQFMIRAPDGFSPQGWVPSEQQVSRASSSTTLSEALRGPQWYLLWSILALNVTAGAALISVAAPLAQDLANVRPTTAAFAVCIIALFNGLGRIFWGSLSDQFGRSQTFLVIFLMQVMAFSLVAITDNFVVMLVPFALIASCYGGGFGTMPAFTADLFGSKNCGTIYGAMLTAWSAGAVAGPILISVTSYRAALFCIALLVAVGSVIPLVFNVVAVKHSRVA